MTMVKCLWFLLCMVASTRALLCYWCSGVGSDRECEHHPYDVRTGPIYINCRSRFCITAKVIDAKTGEVQSFARLCDNIPRGNQCIRDSKLLTCYESCNRDFCNNGNPGPHYLDTLNYAHHDGSGRQQKHNETHDAIDSTETMKMEIYKYNDVKALQDFQQTVTKKGGQNHRTDTSTWRISQDSQEGLPTRKENSVTRLHPTRIEEDENHSTTDLDENCDCLPTVSHEAYNKSDTARAARTELWTPQNNGTVTYTGIRPFSPVSDKPADTDKTVDHGDDISYNNGREVKSFSIVAEETTKTNSILDKSAYFNKTIPRGYVVSSNIERERKIVEKTNRMVRDHRPSHYVSSLEKQKIRGNRNHRKPARNGILFSASTPQLMTTKPHKTSMPSAPFLSDHVNYQTSFHSVLAEQKLSNTDASDPRISKLMSTGSDDDVALQQKPRRHYFRTVSKASTTPFIHFSHPSKTSGSPFKQKQTTYRLFNKSKLRVSNAPTAERHIHSHNPTNVFASHFSNSPVYMYPNTSRTLLHRSFRTNIDQRLPVSLYSNQPTDGSSFQQESSSNTSVSIMEGPHQPLPHPHTSDSGPQITKDSLQLPSIKDQLSGHTLSDGNPGTKWLQNDVPSSLKTSEVNLQQEYKYLRQMTDLDNVGDPSSHDYDAAFVESGYQRDSIDNLVAAFRQHPENRYTLFYEKSAPEPKYEGSMSTSSHLGEEKMKKPISLELNTSKNTSTQNAMNTLKEKVAVDINNTTRPSLNSKESDVTIVRSSSLPSLTKPFLHENVDTTTPNYDMTETATDRSIITADEPNTHNHHIKTNTMLFKGSIKGEPNLEDNNQKTVKTNTEHHANVQALRGTYRENFLDDKDSHMYSVSSTLPETTANGLKNSDTVPTRDASTTAAATKMTTSKTMENTEPAQSTRLPVLFSRSLSPKQDRFDENSVTSETPNITHMLNTNGFQAEEGLVLSNTAAAVSRHLPATDSEYEINRTTTRNKSSTYLLGVNPAEGKTSHGNRVEHTILSTNIMTKPETSNLSSTSISGSVLVLSPSDLQPVITSPSTDFIHNLSNKAVTTKQRMAVVDKSTGIVENNQREADNTNISQEKYTPDHLPDSNTEFRKVASIYKTKTQKINMTTESVETTVQYAFTPTQTSVPSSSKITVPSAFTSAQISIPSASTRMTTPLLSSEQTKTSVSFLSFKGRKTKAKATTARKSLLFQQQQGSKPETQLAHVTRSVSVSNSRPRGTVTSSARKSQGFKPQQQAATVSTPVPLNSKTMNKHGHFHTKKSASNSGHNSSRLPSSLWVLVIFTFVMWMYLPTRFVFT